MSLPVEAVVNLKKETIRIISPRSGVLIRELRVPDVREYGIDYLTKICQQAVKKTAFTIGAVIIRGI